MQQGCYRNTTLLIENDYQLVLKQVDNMGIFLRGISHFTFVVHVARSGIRRRNEEPIKTRAVNLQKWGKNVSDKSFEYCQNLHSVTVSVCIILICSTFL